MIEKIVIENSVLEALASNPLAKAEFSGCLNILTNAPRGKNCKRCGNRPDATYYDQTKFCIAHLDDTKKARLKQLLNAKQAEVVLIGTGGKVQRFHF